MAERSFPFVPRRSNELLAGDLWSIPLSDGRFACGRVLGHAEPSTTGATVSFIGGLHDWVADQPPNGQSISGAAIRNVGRVHVAAIAAGGGAVVGHRDLNLDGLECPSTVSNYWGDGYAKARAEHIFVKGDPPPQSERRDVSSPLTDEMLRPFRSPMATVQFQSLLTEADFARLAEWMSDQPTVGLRAYGSYDGSITNLEFLRHFAGLRRFAADALYHSLTALDGLRHLPDELDDLVIGQTKTKLDVSIVGRFKFLTRLYVEGQTKGLASIAELEGLEELTLRSITLPDLSMLLPLGRLRALELKLGGTRDLALLPRIGELLYLELWMVKGLSDISAVGELTSLRYLFLQSLRQVVELPDFSGCTALRRIHLETMKGITNLEPLLTARALEELAVVDGSHLQPDAFACLQQHPTLQAVTAGLGSRKKNEAVDKLLGLPPAGSKVPWRSV